MIEHARRAVDAAPFAGARPFRVGATTGLRPVPAWKRDADFLFVQVGFSLDRLLALAGDGRRRTSPSTPG